MLQKRTCRNSNNNINSIGATEWQHTAAAAAIKWGSEFAEFSESSSGTDDFDDISDIYRCESEIRESWRI